MSSFTINTTPTEDQWFSQGRTIYNADNNTSLTALQFFDLIAREPARLYCQTLVESKAARDRAAQLAAWEAASPATKAQILALLGL